MFISHPDIPVIQIIAVHKNSNPISAFCINKVISWPFNLLTMVRTQELNFTIQML